MELGHPDTTSSFVEVHNSLGVTSTILFITHCHSLHFTVYLFHSWVHDAGENSGSCRCLLAVSDSPPCGKSKCSTGWLSGACGDTSWCSTPLLSGGRCYGGCVLSNYGRASGEATHRSFGCSDFRLEIHRTATRAIHDPVTSALAVYLRLGSGRTKGGVFREVSREVLLASGTHRSWEDWKLMSKHYSMKTRAVHWPLLTTCDCMIIIVALYCILINSYFCYFYFCVSYL